MAADSDRTIIAVPITNQRFYRNTLDRMAFRSQRSSWAMIAGGCDPVQTHEEGRVAVNQPPLTVGERIELRRRRLGLSRRAVAQLAGRSEEWLRQIEHGNKLDSIEMLRRLAEVLRIDDPVELIGWVPADRASGRGPSLALVPLNRAIMDHPSTRGLTRPTSPTAPEPARLRAVLDDCWSIWLDSNHRYTGLASRLPEVLMAARTLRAATRPIAGNALAEDAGHSLVDAYHLTRTLLTEAGHHQLAWLVADRPVGILAGTAEPSSIAKSSWHVSCALLALGYHAEARDYAMAAAQRLAATPMPDTFAICLSGALRLVAAEGAAADGDLLTSNELLRAARRIADRVYPETRCTKVRFDLTEVAISTMRIALRMGRTDDALRSAAEVDLTVNSPVDTRARYHLTTAYAYSQAGEDFAALIALRQAHDACPEDIRYGGSAHRTLQKISRRDHHLIRRDLTELLELAGLA